MVAGIGGGISALAWSWALITSRLYNHRGSCEGNILAMSVVALIVVAAAAVVVTLHRSHKGHRLSNQIPSAQTR